MLGLTQKDPLAATPCQSFLRVVRCVSRRCRREVVAVPAMAVNGCSPVRHLPNILGLLCPPCHCTCRSLFPHSVCICPWGASPPMWSLFPAITQLPSVE